MVVGIGQLEPRKKSGYVVFACVRFPDHYSTCLINFPVPSGFNIHLRLSQICPNIELAMHASQQLLWSPYSNWDPDLMARKGGKEKKQQVALIDDWSLFSSLHLSSPLFTPISNLTDRIELMVQDQDAATSCTSNRLGGYPIFALIVRSFR